MTEKIMYFRITDERGTALGSGELVPVSSSFSYLSFIMIDVGMLTINLYDMDKQQLYTGHFNTNELTVVVQE